MQIHHFVGKGYNDREQQLVDTAGRRPRGRPRIPDAGRRKVETIREDLGKVGPVIAEQVQEAMLGRRVAAGHASRPRPRPSRCASCSSSSATSRSRSSGLMEQLARHPSGNCGCRPRTSRRSSRSRWNWPGSRRWRGQGPGIWPDPKRQHVPGLPPARPDGQLGSTAPRAWRTRTPGEVRPVRLRPRPGQGPGRRGAGPPEPPAGADEPAAAAGRGLVAPRAEEAAAPHHGPGRARPALQHLAVVAHARLVVIGGDSHRLHEEIITAGGQIREGTFLPVRVAEGNAGQSSPPPPTRSRPRR